MAYFCKFVESGEGNLVQKCLVSYDKKKIRWVKLKNYKSFKVIFVNFPI